MAGTERYSHKLRKTFGVLSVVFFALTIVFIAVGIATDSFFTAERMSVGLVAFVVMGVFFCVPVFLIVFCAFISQVFHVRRMDKHEETDSNKYRNDSVIAFGISAVLFAASLIGDLKYIIKWNAYDMMEDAIALAVPLCFVSLLILIVGLSFFRQKNTDKYIDNVDARDGRRVRTDIMAACAWLIFFGVVSAVAISMADSMTEYVYKSRNGRYEKTTEDFLRGATLNVSSESLKDGVWDPAITDIEGTGQNLSPQISFDSVEGASYYVIYMVDESANNWVHWFATDVTQTALPLGLNVSAGGGDKEFLYRGPYPPKGSGEHVYTIFVYALAGEPGLMFPERPEFDEPWFSGDLLYYDYLNVSDSSCKPYKYGNVLAYGYIRGTVEN